MSICSSFQQKHRASWDAIAKHEFLRRVGEGSTPEDGFTRWLGQDYHFVAGLVGYVGGIIQQFGAHERLSRPLAAAVDVLMGELDLFQREGSRFGVEVGTAELSPACFNYLNYLAVLQRTSSPAVNLTAYWALEQAYLDGWRYVASIGRADVRLSGFIANWTCREFSDYVDLLRENADSLLQPHELGDAEAAFVQVMRFEHQFWDLGLGDEAWPLSNLEQDID